MTLSLSLPPLPLLSFTLVSLSPPCLPYGNVSFFCSLCYEHYTYNIVTSLISNLCLRLSQPAPILLKVVVSCGVIRSWSNTVRYNRHFGLTFGGHLQPYTMESLTGICTRVLSLIHI